MGPGEKKVAVVLVVVLLALVGVYFKTQPKGPNTVQMPATVAAQGAKQAGNTSGAGCATTGSNAAGGVATREFGKKGAKVDIVALLPITHGCHVNTEAELIKAQKEHPADVHLIIVDLFGGDASKFLGQVGGGQRAVISINGKTTYPLKGRQVTFERQENQTYQPQDIGPVIDDLVKKG